MSYFLALCLAICWGTAFLSAKNIVDVLPPCWGAFFRIFAGLLFLFILYLVKGKSLKIESKQLWRPCVIGFLLILLPFVAVSWGQRFIAPTIGALINGSVPMWAFISGAIILKGVDSFTWTRATGVLFGLIGLFVIAIPTLDTTTNTNPMALYGYIALLIMALSYGIGNVLTKKIMVDDTTTSQEANTVYQYFISATILLVIALCFEPIPNLSSFNTKVIISIVCAGVFSSAIAFLLMVELIKRWGATRMASVTYLTPLVAMVGDIIFLQRYPNKYEIIGFIIIFISFVLISKPVKDKNLQLK